jgi:Zn-dependent oligopeptidase
MTNPFFEPSTLPFGLPLFEEITDAHYLPAFEKSFVDQLAEIAEITACLDEPTFENTFVPLETSGQLLERVSNVFFNKCSSDSNDFTNELEETLAPLLAAHSDAITLDAALFSRIAAVHATRADRGLDAESRYLVERYFDEFTIAGAGLDDAAKAGLREYNKILSSLTTRFEKNLLADTNDRRSFARGDFCCRRGRDRAGAHRLLPRDVGASDRASVPVVAHQSRLSRAHHDRLPLPRNSRKRERQHRPRDRDNSHARRACSPARL